MDRDQCFSSPLYQQHLRARQLELRSRILVGFLAFCALAAVLLTILWNSKALDGIAVQRGCSPLTTFVSRPHEQGEPDRLRPIQHEPGQALAAVSDLLDALAHEPRIFGQAEQIVRDFQEFEASLRTAKDRGGRFYFHLGEGTFRSDPDWRRRYDGLKIERTELA